MSKTAHISTRINATDKTQVSLRRCIQFPVELPNEETRQAIQDVRDGKLTPHGSVDELMKDLMD